MPHINNLFTPISNKSLINPTITLGTDTINKTYGDASFNILDTNNANISSNSTGLYTCSLLNPAYSNYVDVSSNGDIIIKNTTVAYDTYTSSYKNYGVMVMVTQNATSTYNSGTAFIKLYINQKKAIINSTSTKINKIYGDSSFNLITAAGLSSTNNIDPQTFIFSINSSYSYYASIDSSGNIVINNAYTILNISQQIPINVTQSFSPTSNYINPDPVVIGLNISKKTPTITATSTTINKIYGDSSFNLITAAGLDSDNKSTNLTFSIDTSYLSYASIDVSGNIIISGAYVDASNTSIPIPININQQGISNYNSAQQKTINLYIAKKTAIITATSTTINKVYGDGSFNLVTAAGLSSNNPDVQLNYSIDSSYSSYATINSSSGQVTIVGAYANTSNNPYLIPIKVNQASSSNYTSASQKSINLYITKKTPSFNTGQYTFTTSYTKTYGDSPFSLNIATEPGSGSLSYTNLSNGQISVDSATGYVTVLAGGTAYLSVKQLANQNYLETSPVQITFNINKKTPLIIINGLTTINNEQGFFCTYGDPSFPISVSSNSDVSISWVSLSPELSVTGNDRNAIITINGVPASGYGVISLSQIANNQYSSATATVKIYVAKKTPTINNGNIITYNKTYGDSSFYLDVSTDSTGSLTYVNTSPNITVTNSGQVIILSTPISPIQITVNQAESTNYTSGTTTYIININKASTIITTNTLIYNVTYGVSPFNIFASLNVAGIPLLYKSLDETNVKLNGNQVTINDIPILGYSEVQIYHETTTNYLANSITVRINISKIPVTILINGSTYPYIFNKTYGDSDFDLNLSSNNTDNIDNSYDFEISSNIISNINRNQFRINNSGTAIITVKQASTKYFSEGIRTITINIQKQQTQINIIKSVDDQIYGANNINLANDYLETNNLFSNYIFTSLYTNVAIIDSDNTIKIIGAGTAFINILQNENDKFTSYQTSVIFKVSKQQNTLQLNPITDKKYEEPFAISVDTNSNGNLYYVNNTPDIASIDNNGNVTSLKTGIAEFIVFQETNEKYEYAKQSISVSIIKNSPSLKFADNISEFNITYGIDLDLSTKISTKSEAIITYTTLNTENITVDPTTGIIKMLTYTNNPIIVTINQVSNDLYEQQTITAQISLSKAFPSLRFKDNNDNFMVRFGSNINLYDYILSNSIGNLSFTSLNPSVVDVNSETGIINILYTDLSENDFISIEIDQAETNNFFKNKIVAKIIPVNSDTRLMFKNNINTFDITYGATLDLKSYLLTNSDGVLKFISSKPNDISIDQNTGIITILNVTSELVTINIEQLSSENYNYGSITAIVSSKKSESNLKFKDDIDVFNLVNGSEFNLLNNIITDSNQVIQLSSSNNTFVTINNDNTLKILEYTNQIIKITIYQNENTNYKSGEIIALINIDKANPLLNFVGINEFTLPYNSILKLTDYISTVSNGDIQIISLNNSSIQVNNNTNEIKTISVNADPINIRIIQYETVSYMSGEIIAKINTTKAPCNLSVKNTDNTSIFNLINGDTLNLMQYVVSDNPIKNIHFTSLDNNTHIRLNEITGLVEGINITTNPINIMITQETSNNYIQDVVTVQINVVQSTSSLSFKNNISNFEVTYNDTFNLAENIITNSNGKITYISSNPQYVSVDENTGQIEVLSVTNETIRIQITQEAYGIYESNIIVANIILKKKISSLRCKNNVDVFNLQYNTLLYLKNYLLTDNNETDIKFASSNLSVINIDTDGLLKVLDVSQDPITITVSQDETNNYNYNSLNVIIITLKITPTINFNNNINVFNIPINSTLNIQDYLILESYGKINLVSSNNTIVSVNNLNILTGLKLSSNPITILISQEETNTYNATSNMAIINVTKNQPNLILDNGTDNTNNLSMLIKTNLNLMSYIKTKSDGNLIFFSLYPSIVSVTENGILTAISETNNIIPILIYQQATNIYEDQSLTALIQVRPKIISQLTIPSKVISIKFKQNTTFKINISSTNPSPFTYGLTTAGKKLVSIDANGNVTLMKKGVVIVTITQPEIGDYTATTTKVTIKMT